MADGLSSTPARRAIEPVSMTLYDADFQAFADRLGTSFRRYGFAVIADHGLDEAVIEAALDDAKAFFALPEDVKRQYHQPGQPFAGDNVLGHDGVGTPERAHQVER